MSRGLSCGVLVALLAITSGDAQSEELCGGFSVFVYDLPPVPFVNPERRAFELLDRRLNISLLRFEQESLGRTVPFFFGLPCDERFNHTSKDYEAEDKCVAERFGGMGRLRSMGNSSMIPGSVVTYDTMPYSLPWLALRHLLNHCAAEAAEAATLFVVPLPLTEMLRLSRMKSVEHSWLQQHLMRVQTSVFEQQYWSRNGGKDHLVVVPSVLNDLSPQWARIGFDQHSWAPATLVAVQTTKKEGFAVPYPTIFHPRSDQEVDQWMAFVTKLPRHRAGVFVGEWRGRRQRFLELCDRNADVCKWRHVEDRFVGPLEEYGKFAFSLQPAGETSTRRGFFESLLMGTIPIVFRRGEDTCKEACPTVTIDGGRRKNTYDEVYAKFFGGGNVNWLSDVSLVAHDEKEAMKYLRETPEGRINKIRTNIIRMIPRILYWDTTYVWSQDAVGWKKHGPKNAVSTLLQRLRDEMASEKSG
uniref:Exostosin GT47 domain-containing protein n=1 Tax=Pinguiococcus pyrenoidosus TaxID=172671 RepID=A0A6U0UFI3_9STRA|mmetsp:Transcript_1768/g.7695  ORF Transcript_1768/g.7695 Transcript_1768/m.7695 type:complete len:471 (+) Transcript_1768:215-1627(+)